MYGTKTDKADDNYQATRQKLLLPMGMDRTGPATAASEIFFPILFRFYLCDHH
jgi:hypothetical protein